MENTHPAMHHLNDGMYQNVFSYWKAGVLGALIVGASAAFGYYLRLMIYAGSDMSRTSWIAAGSFFLAVCVLAVLGAIFISYKPMGYSIFAGAGLVMGAFSLVRFSEVILAGFVLLIIFFASAYSRGQKELETILKIKFFSVVRTVVPLIIMGMSVFAGTAFYGAIGNQPLSDVAPLLMPRSLFEILLVRSSDLFAPAFGGAVDFSLSVRQITAQAVDSAVAQSGLPAASVTPAMRAQLSQKYLPEFETKFEAIAGGPVNLDEPVSQVLYDGLVGRLNALKGNAKVLTLVSIIVLFVLTLLAFVPFIHVAVWVVGFVFYELLLAAGFGVIVYETQSKEVIVLP